LAAAAILKNYIRPEVVFDSQTVVDTSTIELDVGYGEFLYAVSVIFLLLVSGYA